MHSTLRRIFQSFPLAHSSKQSRSVRFRGSKNQKPAKIRINQPSHAYGRYRGVCGLQFTRPGPSSAVMATTAHPRLTGDDMQAPQPSQIPRHAIPSAFLKAKPCVPWPLPRSDNALSMSVICDDETTRHVALFTDRTTQVARLGERKIRRARDENGDAPSVLKPQRE